MSKKLIKFFLLTAVLLSSFSGTTLAQENNVEEEMVIHFFDDRLCPVCRDTKEFLQSIEEDYPHIELKVYPITDTKKLSEVAEEYGVEDYGIMAPTIFIGDNFFQFRDFTSRQQKMIISAVKGEKVEDDCCLIRIPILNVEVDIGDWSLLLISVVLGFIDGFNICSVGALVMVLSIVLALESRKKIFLFGGLFIVTAVATYGLLVFIWTQLFEVLVGQLEILRVIVGSAAFLGGVYFLRDFIRFLKYGPTCKSSDSELIQKATGKLKRAFEQPGRKFYFLAGSVMIFAAVVTAIELPCSVGIPIAFAGILAESRVSLSGYIFYILVYLFIYMLDEFAVFAGAVFTKKIWMVDSKAMTWIALASSVILFYLSFHYLIGF